MTDMQSRRLVSSTSPFAKGGARGIFFGARGKFPLAPLFQRGEAFGIYGSLNLHHRIDRNHAMTFWQDDQRIDVDTVQLIAEADGQVANADNRCA